MAFPRNLAILATCLTLFGAAGCSSIAVRTQPFLGVGQYPPTDPNRVEVLTAEPNRPKERLGEVFIEVSGQPDRQAIESKLKAAAAKLGADAAFIVSDQTRIFPVYYVDYWGTTARQASQRGIIAVAVKYK
jgi:hypothetical protein